MNKTNITFLLFQENLKVSLDMSHVKQPTRGELIVRNLGSIHDIISLNISVIDVVVIIIVIIIIIIVRAMPQPVKIS